MIFVKRGGVAFAAAVFGMVAAAAGDSANVVLRPGCFDVLVMSPAGHFSNTFDRCVVEKVLQIVKSKWAQNKTLRL